MKSGIAKPFYSPKVELQRWERRMLVRGGAGDRREGPEKLWNIDVIVSAQLK